MVITNFTKVTMKELAQVVWNLPSSAAVRDGITAALIKRIIKLSPADLLNTVNYSLRHA